MSEFIQSTVDAYFIQGYLKETSVANTYAPDCVATIIADWLDQGEGIYACHADFQTFLLMVIAIQEYWNANPESTDRLTVVRDNPETGEPETQRITSFLGDLGLRHPIFDQHKFNRTAFDHMHRHQFEIGPRH